MSVINYQSFAGEIRTTLKLDLENDEIIQAWFVRIISCEFLISRSILPRPVSYTKKEVLHLLKLENERLPGIFPDNLFLLEQHYPHHFYEKKMVEKLQTYITNKTPLEEIMSLQENFKDHERYTNFTSTNRNSDIAVTSNNLTTVTQIFTPFFVATWMQENLLKNLKIKLNEVTILDPCLGTGQLLFSLFPKLITSYENNDLVLTIQTIFQKQLYGFDIDEMVIILAKFIFVLKAYEICPSYLDTRPLITPNFIFLHPFRTTNKALKNLATKFAKINLIGSLLQIDKIPNVDKDSLTKEEQEMLQTASLLKQKYDLVITNPPYMGRKVLPDELLSYLNEEFKYGKSELYASFIERALNYLTDNGSLAMLTLHTWLFLKSFKNLREYIINNYQIEAILHLGKNTFSNLNAYNALACAFVINNEEVKRPTLFIRLTDYADQLAKEQGLKDLKNYYYQDQKSFLSLKDTPFIYWLNQHEKELLQTTLPLSHYASLRQGLATSDNKRFIRYWYEVEKNQIGFEKNSVEEFLNSKKRYAPYNKGGDQTKWFTTSKQVIWFDEEAYQILQKQGNHLPSKEYYFKSGITWSLFGFNSFNVRYKETGYVFDVSGSSLFTSSKLEKYILGFLSSKVAFFYLSSLAPTVNFQVSNIASLPLIIDEQKLPLVDKIVDNLITKAKYLDKIDELSWHYQGDDFYLNYQSSLSFNDNLNLYLQKQQSLKIDMKKEEDELDQIFQTIYQINNLSFHNNANLDNFENKDKFIKNIIENLISYLVGVSFSRYQIRGFKSTIKKEEFVKISEVVKNVESLIIMKMTDRGLEAIEKILTMNLEKYLEHYFGKIHLKKYHYLPIYWYNKNQEMAYYHTLKDPKIDFDLGIKANYLKFVLKYNLKK